MSAYSVLCEGFVMVIFIIMFKMPQREFLKHPTGILLDLKK